MVALIRHVHGFVKIVMGVRYGFSWDPKTLMYAAAKGAGPSDCAA